LLVLCVNIGDIVVAMKVLLMMMIQVCQAVMA